MKLSANAKMFILVTLAVSGMLSLMRVEGKFARSDVIFVTAAKLLGLDLSQAALPLAHVVFVWGRVALVLILAFAWSEELEKGEKSIKGE